MDYQSRNWLKASLTGQFMVTQLQQIKTWKADDSDLDNIADLCLDLAEYVLVQTEKEAREKTNE